MVIIAVLLRWQELSHVVVLRREISANKAVFPCYASAFPVLWCGTGWWWFCFSTKLQRRKLEWRCWATARFNKRPYALFISLIRAALFPLLAGRGGEDEGLCRVVVFGAGGGRDSCGTAFWRRSSMALAWPSTLRAGGQQLQAWTPALRQVCFNLPWRPSRVLAAALLSHPESSGFVPDSCVGGCCSSLLFIGAGEEDDGAVCVPLSLSRVCFVKVEDLFLCSVYCKVLFVNCIAPLNI